MTKNLQRTKNHQVGQTCKTSIGVHGLRLKRFEEVVAKLLNASVEPRYVALPPPPQEFQASDNHGDDWLFSSLPQSARVVGNHPHAKRAQNKEGQLRSMLRGILHLVPQNRSMTLVDFGGGSGHLGIPLALLLPHCKVIVVDLNKRSINLMHEKAEKVVREINSDQDRSKQQRFVSKLPKTLQPSKMDLNCCGSPGGVLGNLFTFSGPAENFDDPLDIAIALHLCGEATDVCLRKAIFQNAIGIVVAPCCVGKLSNNVFNPDVFHATGQNDATVSYPQSALFGKILSGKGYETQQDWNALAKAADYSDEAEIRTSRNASRRTAKALLETDRRHFLQDHHGYETALAKMDPLEVTPKNDILVAWKSNSYEENKQKQLKELFGTPDTNCETDIAVTKAHLLSPNGRKGSDQNDEAPQKKQKQLLDRNDWTHKEEAEIETTIAEFMNQTPNEILVFPTKMGGRKRKLIHFVAGKLKLASWGQGKKFSEKTVAVAKTRPPKTEQSVVPKNG